ncbi:MAG: alpha/beta fold hydrolase [Planctomycetes bacterium]|nr:alpha/beta fold hydrolase [Planctomycetota bacterium]
MPALHEALKGLYPFESRYLDLDGLRLHYLDEGGGEPVVMIHGNPTWSFYYRNLALGLRDSYRIIAPDHIGCGLSNKPGASLYDYSLARRIEDLERLIEHLGLTRPLSLVLHDWGGMIGMGYAVRHPDRIKAIVVLNTAAFHLPKSKAFPWSLRVCRDTWIGSYLVRRFNVFSRIAARVCCKAHPLSRRARQAYLLPYDSWDNRIAILRFVQDIPLRPGDRSYDRVSEIERGLDRLRDRPVLICWGEKDFVFDEHFLEEWIRRFPGAAVHRFADAGHYVLEDAGDEILLQVRKFLKSMDT